MKTVFFSCLMLLVPLAIAAQTGQTDYATSDESNNTLIFIGDDEWQPEWIDQTGESNTAIVFNEALLVPLFLISQQGIKNRALMVQFSADSTGIENHHNRVRIKQKGKGNSATVIQHD